MRYDRRYAHVFTAVLLIVLSVLLTGKNTKKADILILAPHPDDAALCCAGLIQQATSKGQSVHILELTNGEAYAEAAAYLSKKPAASITATDYLRLGKARKQEEYRAMNILGLTPRNITFLGYPDGLLEEVYTTRSDTPFLSRFTGLSATLETGNPYTHADVVRDIVAVIAYLQPAQIVVPNMSETALDHTVARRFVDDAMITSAFRGQLLTYIIHSDTTPTHASNASILRIRLSAHEMRLKRDAIAAYRTQNAIDGEYLSSFVRDEEIFVQLEQP